MLKILPVEMQLKGYMINIML